MYFHYFVHVKFTKRKILYVYVYNVELFKQVCSSTDSSVIISEYKFGIKCLLPVVKHF